MRCDICGDEVKNIHPRERHLVITKDCQNDEIHIHGDLSHKELMKDFMEAAEKETGVSLQKQILERKEIVFHNRQRVGDILMFTCGVRDFKKAFPDVRVNVISTAMHIWDNNPYLDHNLIGDEDNIVKIGPGALTNASNRLDWHFANAFRVSIENALKVHIPQGESRPDIWLTEEEYNAPRIFEDPYWLIVIGGEKGWGCKMYPFERWQEFVSQNPDTLFVQLGTLNDNHPRLQGANIIDYVGKTEDRDKGIRDLFKLFLNAEGSIGLVSFHMHLSGAFNKPAIVLAGAREPVSFTRYPGHQYLATDGCLPCSARTACWHCDINACTDLRENKVPACVDMIEPAELTRALNQYYRGGRLKKGVISDKPKLTNIVKTQIKAGIPEPSKTDITKYGMAWGGGCITEKDWQFMQYVIKKHNIKTVLEFGSGLSTLLMNEAGLKVITFETDQGWINKLKAIKQGMDIHLWNGKEVSEAIPAVDLAFVDGPAGGGNREISTKLATSAANIVIIHDANREYERKWQEKYIQGAFKGPLKGGNRCHFWKKEPIAEVTGGIPRQDKPQSIISAKDDDLCPEFGGKFIKVVSTSRGWGGCARSITTIMDMLLKAGHRVEFIPFRNKVTSFEFRQWVEAHPDLIVTEDYSTVKEPCDVLFMYADDYVWEFEQIEIAFAFTNLQAKRKIMMLNYRRGKVGQLPWTQHWDKYMFLNSTQEKELLKVLPEANTKVLPPCTDLSEFFKVQPNYNEKVRLVRHNSQGDTKFAKNFAIEIGMLLASREDLEINMMPGPSFIETDGKVKKYPKNQPPIPEFLGMGNLFWYSLPEGYLDMGPRVILEAMAAGLPVLADNWGGAVDRVTPECGWLCNSKEEHSKIIKNLTFDELKKKGEAARERAKKEFVSERWMEEVC